MRHINGWFYIPAFIFLGLGFVALDYIPYGDELAWFNAWKQEPYNTFFRILTVSAEGVLYGLIALFLIWRKERRVAFLLALCGLLTIPMSYFLKELYDAPRPARWLDETSRKAEVIFVQGIDLNGGYHSFPSGHTMSAFAVYGFLSILLLQWKRASWGLLLALIAIGVGISRIFLVQHFLVDVMAGAACGIAMAWSVWSVNKLFQRYF